jgi:predicted ATP-binding protein involved in virulence
MINQGSAPEFFQSDFVLMAQEKLEEFYASMSRSQKRYDFPFNKKFDEEVAGYLAKVFHGKCGYCERHIGDAGLVDRFRPFSGVRDSKEFHQDLYWWLAFNWYNLVYCCQECFQYKANYFPVLGKRALDFMDDLSAEECLLFDPCRDNASLHFGFDQLGNILPLTAVGKQTIDLLRLDRNSLRNQRRSARNEILNMLERDYWISPETIQKLRSIYLQDPGVGMLTYKRWVLLNEMKRDPYLEKGLGVEGVADRLSLREEIGTYGSRPEGMVANDYFPIEQVRIRNFRGITDLTVNFKADIPPRRSWLFLLGENGAGKSSVLQAIALGLRVDKTLLAPRLVRELIYKGKEEAEIIIKERDSDRVIRTSLRRSDGTVLQEGRFNSFLFGYGSLRLSSDEAEKAAREDKEQVSYDNLFHPVRPLNDITQWLKEIFRRDTDLFDRVAYSIKQLLPHDFYDNELTIIDGEIVFRNSEKSFSSLSDGFKSTIILAVDIMMKLSSANADVDKLSGVVLIDELGNQLHPRWQMRIVQQLRKVFTNLNFIVSTHHPLCLRGSQEGEVLLLKQADGVLLPVTDLPDPASLRVDQILASEFFGLNSLIDPELEAAFNRYYALLAREENLTAKERAELSRVKDELREKKQLGASLREELMYAVIDSLLASKVNKFSREELKREAVKRVAEIWNKTNNHNYDQG